MKGKKRAAAKGKAKAKPLTPRQRLFIEEYLTCWNASEAARRAGYKSKADVQGARLLVNASIRSAIDARLAEKRMSADEVLARLTSHASGSLAHFLNVHGEDAYVDLTTDEAKANLHLLKEIETERRRYGKEDNPVEEFKVKIKIHDPQAALVHLGRYHKLFTDKVEVDDSGLDDSERAERIAALLDRARARRDGQAAH